MYTLQFSLLLLEGVGVNFVIIPWVLKYLNNQSNQIIYPSLPPPPPQPLLSHFSASPQPLLSPSSASPQPLLSPSSASPQPLLSPSSASPQPLLSHFSAPPQPLLSPSSATSQPLLRASLCCGLLPMVIIFGLNSPTDQQTSRC